MVRRRGGRKRALGTRAPMLVPQWPNDRWSLDFVADQFIDGRRLRILVVVDDCTRECLALVPDTSISGTRVARELDRLIVLPAHDHRQRQRHRADLERHPAMDRRPQGRVASSRRASRFRMPSPSPSSVACATSCSMRLRPLALTYARRSGSLACRLQQRTAPFAARLDQLPAIYAAARRSAALRSTDGFAPRTAAAAPNRAYRAKLQSSLDKSWATSPT